MNCTEPLQYSGDIAGRGVRISFYVQNLILVLLIGRSHEETENALWTFISTSVGLTIAALVQLGSGNGALTLLDGILVSQLAWFANLGTFLALASYSRSKGQQRAVKVAAVLQGYFAMILTIIMWAMADKMPSSSCPSIKFVFMFAITLPALGSGRIVALVFASITLLMYTTLTYIEFWALVKHGQSRLSKEADQHHIETGRPYRPSGIRQHHSRRHSSMKQGRGRHGVSHQVWLPADVGPVFFGILLFQLVIFVYFIATTELIIKRSNAVLSDPTNWGFGQVLAITVVLPSLVELYRAMKALYRAIGARLHAERELVQGSPRLRSTVPATNNSNMESSDLRLSVHRSPPVEV